MNNECYHEYFMNTFMNTFLRGMNTLQALRIYRPLFLGIKFVLLVSCFNYITYTHVRIRVGCKVFIVFINRVKVFIKVFIKHTSKYSFLR